MLGSGGASGRRKANARAAEAESGRAGRARAPARERAGVRGAGPEAGAERRPREGGAERARPGCELGYAGRKGKGRPVLSLKL